MEIQAEVSAIHYYIFPDSCDTPEDIPSGIRELYTADGSKFCIQNAFIQHLGGGDSEYMGWFYNSHESYETGPQVQVRTENYGEWDPIK